MYIHTGNTLDITGTVTLFMSSQATGEKKRMIEAAVLRGGKDCKLLFSLKNLKKFQMIRSSFPHQNIEDFFLTYKSSEEYSSV